MVSALRKPPLVRQVEDAACVCVCVRTEQVGESLCHLEMPGAATAT